MERKVRWCASLIKCSRSWTDWAFSYWDMDTLSAILLTPTHILTCVSHSKRRCAKATAKRVTGSLLAHSHSLSSALWSHRNQLMEQHFYTHTPPVLPSSTVALFERRGQTEVNPFSICDARRNSLSFEAERLQGCDKSVVFKTVF